MSQHPLIGKTLADRYEIGVPIKAGGMGAVFRGKQHSLGREVAIKLLRPDVASRVAAERFIAEARALSGLSHPHIVSTFDFGRATIDGVEVLYLVMELLSGRDLEDVIDAREELPIARVVEIVGQVLQGLGEAHHRGIIHRDVKPANILLTPRRSGLDHVKIIDFGIARVLGTQRLTDAGIACGTIGYVAPEQAANETIGPFTDVYSAGVLLYELLTLQAPFVRDTPTAMMLAHMGMPRPDPRAAAPHRDIPVLLALACMKAMSIRPENRYASAAAMEAALRESLALPRSNRRPPAFADTLPLPPLARGKPAPGRELVGRDTELAWAARELASPSGAAWIEYEGGHGAGKTRLLEAIAQTAKSQAMATYAVPIEPPPHGEITFRALGRIIEALSGLTPRALAHDPPPADASVMALEGLRVVLLRATPRSSHPEGVRRAAAAALGWAARRAVRASVTGRVALFVDDADDMDLASLNAMADQQRSAEVHGFVVVLACRRALARRGPNASTRKVMPLSRGDAIALRARLSQVAMPLPAGERPLEPLYLVLAARAEESRSAWPAPTLRVLVQRQIEALGAPELRVLQAVAVAGGATIGEIETLLGHSTSPEREELLAVNALLLGGFLVHRGDRVVPAHRLFAKVALDLAGADWLSATHARLAAAIGRTPHLEELRAYHAIRGRADFTAFLAMEETAAIRRRYGDDVGAMNSLWQAVRAARAKLTRGDPEAAAEALSTFGRKLAAALVEDGQLDEAQAILEEVASVSMDLDLGRALVFEQLAALAQLRGKPAEAEAHLGQALQIAVMVGNEGAIDRIAALLPGAGSGPASSTIALGRRADGARESPSARTSVRPRFDATQLDAGLGGVAGGTSGVE